MRSAAGDSSAEEASGSPGQVAPTARTPHPWILGILAVTAVAVASPAEGKRKPVPRPAKVGVSLPAGDSTIGRVTVRLTGSGSRLKAPKTITAKLANRTRLPRGLALLTCTRRISRTKRTAKYHAFVAVLRPVLFSPVYPNCANPPFEDGVFDEAPKQPLDAVAFAPATTYRLVEEACGAVGNPPDCTKVRPAADPDEGSAG